MASAFSVGDPLTAAEMNAVCRALWRKTTVKDVNSTVAATDLLNSEVTVDAGILSTNRLFRGVVFGDLLNNTGGSLSPPRLQLLLGGTTLVDTGVPPAGSAVSSALRLPWRVEFEILNQGSASVQFSVLQARFWILADSATTGIGGYNIGSNNPFDEAFVATSGTTAVNTASACALVLNTINPSASASYSVRLQGAVFEVV